MSEKFTAGKNLNETPYEKQTLFNQSNQMILNRLFASVTVLQPSILYLFCFNRTAFVCTPRN